MSLNVPLPVILCDSACRCRGFLMTCHPKDWSLLSLLIRKRSLLRLLEHVPEKPGASGASNSVADAQIRGSTSNLQGQPRRLSEVPFRGDVQARGSR